MPSVKPPKCQLCPLKSPRSASCALWKAPKYQLCTVKSPKVPAVPTEEPPKWPFQAWKDCQCSPLSSVYSMQVGQLWCLWHKLVKRIFDNKKHGKTKRQFSFLFLLRTEYICLLVAGGLELSSGYQPGRITPGKLVVFSKIVVVFPFNILQNIFIFKKVNFNLSGQFEYSRFNGRLRPSHAETLCNEDPVCGAFTYKVCMYQRKICFFSSVYFDFVWWLARLNVKRKQNM